MFGTFHPYAITTIVGLLTYQLVCKFKGVLCKLFCTDTIKLSHLTQVLLLQIIK